MSLPVSQTSGLPSGLVQASKSLISVADSGRLATPASVSGAAKAPLILPQAALSSRSRKDNRDRRAPERKPNFVPMDGNSAVARIAYQLSDDSYLYPITPATTAGEAVEVAASMGERNVWNRIVNTNQMESEMGVAGAMHGSLLGGSLSTTFSASQGLLLMVPTMYRIAGDLMPGVIHCASRAVSSTTSCIYNDHSDVMACRQTGWGILHATNVQEAHDMALITHLAAWRTSLPFLHFYDGFRTSHEIQNVNVIPNDVIHRLVYGGDNNPYHNAIQRFRAMSQNPAHPFARGAIGNSDTFYQAYERNNLFYKEACDKVQLVMDDVSAVIGRRYRLMDYIGHPEAEDVVVMMGSGAGVMQEVVEKLSAQGSRVGLIKVRMYRPFPTAQLLSALPVTTQRVTVLDKVHEQGAEAGEPLFLDVQAAISAARDGHNFGQQVPPVERVINGIYGLGGRDFTPNQALSVLDNMAHEDVSRIMRRFTVGVIDDVTHMSLPPPIDETEVTGVPEGTVQCLIYGCGSDGSVSASKSAIKMIADNTNLYTQGYTAYDAKKCFKVGTEMLKFDGSIVKVEELKAGDELRAPNGAVRTIAEVHSGSDKLYRIHNNGELIAVVNSEHILHLEGSEQMSVKQYMELDEAKKADLRIPRVEKEASTFEIEEEGEGEFVGFSLNEDPLFVLPDGHIMHNSGGITVSHLRFGPNSLMNTSFMVKNADYVGIHHPSYVAKLNILSQLKPGGIVVLNVPWPAELANDRLPAAFRSEIARKGAKLFVIDASKVAQAAGLPPSRISNVLQACFWKLANVLPLDEAMDQFKKTITKQFKAKGQDLVEKNIKAAVMALDLLKEVSYEKNQWLTADRRLMTQEDIDELTALQDREERDSSISPANIRHYKTSFGFESDALQNSLVEATMDETREKWVRNVLRPFAAKSGSQIPVSAFLPGGLMPTSTSRYEKRAMASFVPEWDASKCISCAECLLACPHACLRPVISESEVDMKARGLPEDFTTTKAVFGSKVKKSHPNARLRIQLSAGDCTGCKVCTSVCPTNALNMRPFEEIGPRQMELWDVAMKESGLMDPSKNKFLQKLRDGKLLKRFSKRGAAIQESLYEFSAACAGCGEAPYIRLLTLLFGESLNIANATGCSSVCWSGFPTNAGGVNHEGHGPAWARSLFENNGQFGLGLTEAYDNFHEYLRNIVSAKLPSLFADSGVPRDLVAALEAWCTEDLIEQQSNDVVNKQAEFIRHEMEVLERDHPEVVKRHAVLSELVELSSYLTKTSTWIVGGDGFAYDIGSAGIDHLLNSDSRVRILILDTQQYSNTGGQLSKATPPTVTGSLNKKGKQTMAKDLGLLAMTTGNAYVASISLGADSNQAIKALTEAEKFNGPSIVIAYSTCKDHGIPAQQAAAEAEAEADGTTKKEDIAVAGNMDRSLIWQKEAVASGFWPLYRFDPSKDKPLSLDYEHKGKDQKALDKRLAAFISSETRFNKMRDQSARLAARSTLMKSVRRNTSLRKLLSKISHSQDGRIVHADLASTEQKK